MNVSNVKAMNYRNFIPLAGYKNKPNQTQFKPNSKPISKMPKMNASSILTKDYERNDIFAVSENKAKTNPNKANLCFIFLVLSNFG